MKIFAIRDRDSEDDSIIGYLICYEKANEYIVELIDDLDEWDAPLLFQKYVREQVFTIPKAASRMWVEERLIPRGRQNIGAILKNAKMQEYDEVKLLALSKGKCSQDNCYLEEIHYEDIPENIRKRSECCIVECFYTEDKNIVCMFRDNLVRKISLSRLMLYYEGISNIINNENLLKSVKVDVSGQGISFGDVIEIPKDVLRDEQFELQLTAKDFHSYVQNNIVDTTNACERMNCSRQNISYLVGKKKLNPVMNGTKEKYFTLGNIERVINE